MKRTFLLLTCTLISLSIQAQSVIGAWETYQTLANGDTHRYVVIFAEGYQAMSVYDSTTGKFIHANGGTWKLEGDMMTEKIEFDSNNPDRVGTEPSFKVIVSENTLETPDNNMKLNRIDDGTPGKLQGAWLMSGRVRDGETQLRDTSGPRKTMKLLSGTRFQWIAYHTESKKFIGSGGGTYTTVDGKYTENIEFFSKDDSKAGISLPFDYKLIDGNWHHSGLSSKGDPMHEIWSVRE